MDKKVIIYAVKDHGFEVCLQCLYAAVLNYEYYKRTLIKAAQNGHVKCLKTLIDAGADVINARFEVELFLENRLAYTALIKSACSTALMHAAQKNQFNCVKALTQAGADVNIQNVDGCTALMRAAQRGLYGCVKFLLEAGANFDTHDGHGSTALILASQSGAVKCVELLIKVGADVNIQKAYSDETALILAANKGHNKCVEVLIEAGADVNIQKTYSDETALILASGKGHSKCVQILTKAGADVNLRDKNGNTALINVAGHCDVESVRLLIQAGADVNTQNTWGNTALMEAAWKRSFKCMELLIKGRADVNYQNKYSGETALLKAAWKDDDIYVQILIVAGADVNIRNIRGASALGRAVERSLDKSVARLLRGGATVNTVRSCSTNALTSYLRYRMPWNHPSENQRKRIVILLFAAGETIDGTTIRNPITGKDTPLPDYLRHEDLKLNLKHLCRETTRKHLLQLSPVNLFCTVPRLGLPTSLAEYLLYNVSLDETIGPRIVDAPLERINSGTTEIKSSKQLTQRHKMVSKTVMTKRKKSEVIPGLCDECDEFISTIEFTVVRTIALAHSAAKGHVECVKACLKARPDPNYAQVTYRHSTALMCAVQKCHTDCVKTLIQAGAYVNRVQESYPYRTALMVAAQKGDSDCVKVLIKAGADVNIETTEGCIALTIAAIRGNTECVEELIKAGADVNKTNKDGRSALVYAARNGGIKCVKLLIDAGADVNTQDRRGATALMSATAAIYEDVERINARPVGNIQMKDVRMKLHFECVVSLLGAGAYVNKRDKVGRTVLMLAAENGHVEYVRVLIEAGAYVNIQDKRGDTALTYGARNGHDKCVTAVLRAGAAVNTLESQHLNCLTRIPTCSKERFSKDLKEQTIMLLFVAGETIYRTTDKDIIVPDCLKHEVLNLNLKHICREIIRKYLLQLSPVNLFYRVPQLGLHFPTLEKYLPYYVSLDAYEK